MTSHWMLNWKVTVAFYVEINGNFNVGATHTELAVDCDFNHATRLAEKMMERLNNEVEIHQFGSNQRWWWDVMSITRIKGDTLDE